MKVLIVVSSTVATLAALGFALLLSGVFNVAADNPHWGVTRWLLETARDRSIAVRVGGIAVPPLDDSGLIAMGAEHYAEMCTGCHLAPGIEESELRRGLYPQPPNLIEHGRDDPPQKAFWIIKHGFKMTGMPAWGATHDDRSIWAMVAFLRRLPDLSPEAYRALVAKSGNGHTHAEPIEHHDSIETGHDHPADPIAVVDRFFSALAAGDRPVASALLDPEVLIYESGGVERSRDEYAARHLAADAAFLKSAKHRLLSRTGETVGDLAWVATTARLTAQGAQPSDIISTETMVLRRRADDWRIVHIHWSNRNALAPR
ncbi:MAG: c-type cytochrome [Steroidobacteraceae bacterium]